MAKKTIRELAEQFKADPASLTPAELNIIRRELKRSQEKKGDKYTQHKANMSQRMAEASKVGRDVGELPGIVNPPRRESCRLDLEKFGLTYFREALTLKNVHRELCDDQREAIKRVQESALTGALYALGMSRGFAKTTWLRIGALWAISYAHVRYAFLIGATEPKASRNLGAIKGFIRFGEVYGEDFPEISYAVRCLGGVAQRAGGQLCQERPTLIRWDADELVLPTMPKPGGWMEHWKLRSDGMVPTSGSCISVSGLTGEGIRGSLMSLDTGEQLRPDLVLIDDPQTRESSRSPSQNQTRIELVSGDVLGMAGPGQNISAVMLCTPIYPGDMADVLLDRKQHPLWRGDRRPMMRSMPKNMGAWDKYFQVYSRCAQTDPPDFAESNRYYLDNREELDSGAEAAWPECFDPSTEVSAIQSAMHLYFRDPRAFASERQLQPLAIFDPTGGIPSLTTDGILDRVNNHERGIVPAWATTLTAAIDVHDDLLYYCVSAWGEGFAGAVVERATWPEQNRLYFSLRDAAPTLKQATRIATTDGAIRAGLECVAKLILARDWQQATGSPMRVTQCLVDGGYKPEVVYRFCRESQHAAVLIAGKGIGIGAAKAPIADWAKVAGERKQRNENPTWVVRNRVGRGRQCLFDANHWKSFVADRLLTPMGERSALSIFGPADHRLFADHLTAERRERTFHPASGRTVDEWQANPGQDNHWFDTLVSTAVGASLQGVTMEGAAVVKPRERAPVDVAKEQAERRAAFQAKSGAGSIAEELRQRRAAFEARRRMG